ncbi:hypothetical protein KSF_045670 [Reticulibacter mediterranei]|uniref:PatA-like N-terminal domain-containing protein n=1 Tax=Reticulibacter mediterranei TaxID=2778369 RepID=A0A8J3IMY8_9CHLR|nr:DUF4388 domain-containing protein [Reticulibacter mediterranei]GHO94519.1 hypothetical protein KSF_045670 [Reticulibacter mediterranei]
MKLRGTATDKLADVIQMLQLVHRTGLLRVQRAVDNGVEEGSITFQDGQVMDANAGATQGSDAYKRLMTWTTCNFVFEALPSSASPSLPPTSAPPARPATGNITRPLPAYTREPPVAYSGVPYRVWPVGEVLPDFQRLGLSRVHRQLFLLIDGRRTVYELMNLIRRHPQEVSAMLTDLEYAGLVKQ